MFPWVFSLTHVTRPEVSATRRPRIPVQRLVKVFDTLAEVRAILSKTRNLAAHVLQEDAIVGGQIRFLEFMCNSIVAQAYRHIAARMKPSAILQAAAMAPNGHAEYEYQLRSLLVRSEDELYSAIYDVVFAFKSALTRADCNRTGCVISGASFDVCSPVHSDPSV